MLVELPTDERMAAAEALKDQLLAAGAPVSAAVWFRTGDDWKLSLWLRGAAERTPDTSLLAVRRALMVWGDNSAVPLEDVILAWGDCEPATGRRRWNFKTLQEAEGVFESAAGQ